MDYNILATLLDDYTGQEDAAILDSLNAPTITVYNDLPKSAVYNYLLNNGLWSQLRYMIANLTGNADTPPKMQLLTAGLTAKDFFASDIPTVNSQNPLIQQMIGGFVAGGVFSQAQAAAFFAQFESTTSVAQQQLGGEVTQADINIVRLLPKATTVQALIDANAQRGAVLSAVLADLQSGTDVDITELEN